MDQDVERRLTQAADGLLAAGRPVTVRSLRAATSLRTETVATWLRAHRAANPPPVPPLPAGLEGAARAAAADWWRQARAVLDSEYAERLEGLRAERDAADTAAARADEAREVALADRDSARRRVEELVADLDRARAEHAEMVTTLTALAPSHHPRRRRLRYWKGGRP